MCVSPHGLPAAGPLGESVILNRTVLCYVTEQPPEVVVIRRPEAEGPNEAGALTARYFRLRLGTGGEDSCFFKWKGFPTLFLLCLIRLVPCFLFFFFSVISFVSSKSYFNCCLRYSLSFIFLVYC